MHQSVFILQDDLELKAVPISETSSPSSFSVGTREWLPWVERVHHSDNIVFQKQHILHLKPWLLTFGWNLYGSLQLETSFGQMLNMVVLPCLAVGNTSSSFSAQNLSSAGFQWSQPSWLCSLSRFQPADSNHMEKYTELPPTKLVLL